MQDPSKYDCVTLMRQREWEVITFNNFDKITKYLQQADCLPNVLFLVNLGHDSQADTLISHVRKKYPFIKTALQITGRNPDEFSTDYSDRADMVLHGNMKSSEVLKQLAGLLP